MPERSCSRVAAQVGPADRAREEDVAAEDERRVELVADEDDRAGAVAGDLADLEREAGQLDPLAVGDEPVGRGARSAACRTGAQVGVGVGQQAGLVAADEQGARRGTPASSPALPAMWSACPCVLRIAASLQRAADSSTVKDRLRVEAGIDHRRLLRRARLPDDVGHFCRMEPTRSTRSCKGRSRPLTSLRFRSCFAFRWGVIVKRCNESVSGFAKSRPRPLETMTNTL